MKIHEIENMSAAELKANKDELAKGCKFHTDLSQRYIQARMDAKLRDERMAEYGHTITSLEKERDTLALDIISHKDKVTELDSKLKYYVEEYEKLSQKCDREKTKRLEMQGSVQALNASITELRLKVEIIPKLETELQAAREELNTLKNAPTKES